MLCNVSRRYIGQRKNENQMHYPITWSRKQMQIVQLTHLSLDKMAAISQTTFSEGF